MAEWISVKDRLPERMRIISEITNQRVVLPYSERVFAWTNVGGMTVQYYHDREQWFVSPPILKNILCDGSIVVTHWMPLPEPPGEEGKE